MKRRMLNTPRERLPEDTDSDVLRDAFESAIPFVSVVSVIPLIFVTP